MTWGMVAVAGATLVAGAMSKNSADKAANAQKNAANGAIAASQENYSKTANNLNPYINAGSGALTQMQALNAGDFSSFKASPDYQYTFNQELQGLDRSAASRGSLFSGGHNADVMAMAGGLASQQYGNFYNRLSGLANSGQNAASNLGSVGTGNAASIGSAMTNAGNAQANGIINSSNAQTNTIGQLAGIFGQYMGNRGTTSPTASSYSLNNNNSGDVASWQQYQIPNGSNFNLATAGNGTGGGWY